jgi:hypothetical protein
MSKQSDLVSVSQGSGGDPLYIDTTNDRVGVGTSSPEGSLDIAVGSGDIVSNLDGSPMITYRNGSGSWFHAGKHPSQDAFVFTTGATSTSTERMRIDSGGNLLVGTTSAYAGGNGQGIQAKASANAALCCSRSGEDGATVRFFRDNTLVGNISVTGSSTSYNTSSDYRLKENVITLDGAADRLAQIPVHRFNFISDPDTTVDGFLAHEVQAFVPEAITGEHDGVDADGNPIYQGIDQSKLVPLLTAALQEALQKIDALEARVATLETN